MSKQNLFNVFRYLQSSLNLTNIFPNFDSLHLQTNTHGPRRIYEISRRNATLDSEKIHEELLKEKNLAMIGEQLVQFGFATLDGENEAIRLGQKTSMGTGLQIHSKTGGWKDLGDVGAGTHNLIPIILRGFLSHQTDTVIFENPEHHLHHHAQSKLADLFHAMARESQWQKRLLVETHSTYLVKALQTLVLKYPDLKDHVKIYCCRLEDKQSVVEPVPLQEDGHLQDPPAYFQYDYQQNLEFLDAAFARQEDES